MINTLVQFFIKNGQLDLPSIGILKWSKQASYWELNKFIAPKEFIDFEVTEVVPSKHFYNFLADELNISIEQANLQFDGFIQAFQEQKITSLNFGNLGTLHKNENLVSWNNLYNADLYYKDLSMGMAPLFESEYEQANNNRDYWWVWTIGLILIATALIIYKQL
jgi:hypothetical protein